MPVHWTRLRIWEVFFRTDWHQTVTPLMQWRRRSHSLRWIQNSHGIPMKLVGNIQKFKLSSHIFEFSELVWQPSRAGLPFKKLSASREAYNEVASLEVSEKAGSREVMDSHRAKVVSFALMKNSRNIPWVDLPIYICVEIIQLTSYEL